MTKYCKQLLGRKYFLAVSRAGSVTERRISSRFLQIAWLAASAHLPVALCSAALAVFNVQPERQGRIVLSKCMYISIA